MEITIPIPCVFLFCRNVDWLRERFHGEIISVDYPKTLKYLLPEVAESMIGIAMSKTTLAKCI